MKNELLEQIGNFLEQGARASKPGEIFTTEVEIAARFNISRPTARKYIGHYAEIGKIARLPGKGITCNSDSSDLSPKKSRPKNYLIMVTPFSFADGFFSEIVSGIIDSLNKRGDQYRIFMNIPYEDRWEAIKSISIREYDGAFITAYEDEASYRIVEYLQLNHIPTVLVDNQLDFYHLNCVKNNDVSAGRKLGEYLGKNGLKPAFILPKAHINSASTNFDNCQMDGSVRERISGLKYGLTKYGIPLNNDCFFADDHIDRLIQHIADFDALVFYDAIAVFGVLQEMRQKNVDIPVSIAFCAFGNALLERPAMKCVCVKFNGYAIGTAATQIMLEIKRETVNTLCIDAQLLTVGE